MATLHEIESNFQHFLMTGEEKPIAQSIISDHLARDIRLKIYFDAYRLRLLDILQKDFPKTFTLMGEEVFEQAFMAYLEKHPSSHFSVRYFGQYFFAFLKEASPYKTTPLLSEMADFENAIMDTLDAANASLIDMTELAEISPDHWGSLTFLFHPSLTLKQYHFDTPLIWKEIDAESPGRPPKKLETPQSWILWRKGLRSLFVSLSPAQQILFEAFYFLEIVLVIHFNKANA